MFIKSHITKIIRDSIPECSKVKDFMKEIEEQYEAEQLTILSMEMMDMTAQQVVWCILEVL